KLSGPICKHQDQLNQMVNFKNYTSPSSKLKYLIIESNERPAMQTKLLVRTPLTGWYAGLPIGGSLYEEVIPEATELTGTDAKDQRYTPRVCEYLFAAFHYLQESQSDDSR
ncbi:hypothetical protein HAX54_038880, partial [Datura stramonium]|nr:hypothetical protein [Datura stramonium]